MLNRENHQLIMGQILKDIYTDILIAPLLGFKGGTCAYFFYELPRFSVDLDFDLLTINQKTEQVVFKKIVEILSKYGKVKNEYMKKHTIFAVLSYGDSDHNIKIEINFRESTIDIRDQYEIKNYLGISMLVAKKNYLFSSKLAALTLRSETAMRDIYDIHYFAKKHWDINQEIIKNRTGKNTQEYLHECIELIQNCNDNRILQGLGELINNEKEKSWIKTHLKNDTIFLLKNYISVLN
ncbi:nucleotidyl transferase AbiEii/AbiGii toxin family protein [Candidatus Woesebacteria bacterium]|nr:nucleotidyl transferase AbiEii/AbiGii toxin family protein [Candidatus Woesebacteria bacterium]